VDADRLAELKSELIAIDVWDSAYFRSQQHDDIDEVSYRHRRKRREELMNEIIRIAEMGPCNRALWKFLARHQRHEPVEPVSRCRRGGAL
jgi:hypothetical protein